MRARVSSMHHRSTGLMRAHGSRGRTHPLPPPGAGGGSVRFPSGSPLRVGEGLGEGFPASTQTPCIAPWQLVALRVPEHRVDCGAGSGGYSSLSPE